MRPVLRLLGKCEITVDGTVVDAQITRKHWFVLGHVATAPNCQVGRDELTETAWPLSDDKSRNVLLHMWRRGIVDATSPFCTAPTAHIDEQCVYIDTTYLAVDYQECSLLADVALTSDDAETVLRAGAAFDALAEDKILLPSFPSAFLETRREFDIQRRAVLRRAWQAEAHLQPKQQPLSSTFETRLRSLGDLNPIGDSAIPFKALQSQVNIAMRKSILESVAPRLVASLFIGAIIAMPIILGFLSTTPKQSAPYVLGSNVNKPVADISRRVMFQLRDPRTKSSAASALYVNAKDQIIAAGTAKLINGDHQMVLVMLSKSGQAKWVTKQTDVKGITTVPKQILTNENGRIYVAAEVIAQPNNARNLASGSYLEVSVFTRDGQRLFERLLPDAIDRNALTPLRLTADLKGGVHAFAMSARRKASITLHVPAGPPTGTASPVPIIPKSLCITDAITDSSGHIFLLGYLPVKTSSGPRMDWHLQAMDKASKRLLSREFTGALGRVSEPVLGAINAEGDLVAYGNLPAPKTGSGSRKVPSMVTLSSTSGDVIFREHVDTDRQNPNFAIICLPVGKSAVFAMTSRSSDGSDPFTIHRVGNAKTDTAISITLRFPRDRRLDSIVSFYINQNGAMSALLKPRQLKSTDTALTYSNMVFGRGIETGDLIASKPFAYNTRGGGFIAGHYDNAFCVYNFSRLP